MSLIVPIPVLQDNYEFLVVCEATRKAVIVDAPDASQALKVARGHGVELVAVWNTHHHEDHVGGNAELADRLGVPVLCSAYDYAKGRVPCASRGLKDGEEVTVGELKFRVLEVPGHTLGHIVFCGHGALISGDTLFAGGCGRVFEGTMEGMHASLMRLVALDPRTRVYCMHEYTAKNLEFALTLEPGNAVLRERYEKVRGLRARGLPTVPTTIAEERATNPFLRADSGEILASLAERGLTGLNDDTAVFAAIRRLKDAY